MDAATEPLLTLRGVGKRYAAEVLRSVGLDLHPGRVHALIGANGAGKSTLARIVSGLTEPSSGGMTLDGERYAPAGKLDAEGRGIHIVQQELNLIEPLSIAENLFLNRLPRRRGLIDYRELHERASQALDLVDLGALDPRTPLGRLGVARRQLVEIAAALSRQCRCLILDEPTAALNGPQVERLFEHVSNLRAAGVAVVYISHRMEEIHRICDVATVLRDGRVTATRATTELPLDEAVRLMTGDANERETRSRSAEAKPQVPDAALRVEKLCRGTLLRDVSFEARCGEVLGVAGLAGAGRTELLRAVFGADVADSGAVYLPGADEPRRFLSPHQAVQAGLAMTPEDRKHDGLLLEKSIRLNVTLGPAGRWGLAWTDREAEASAARGLAADTEIHCGSIEQPVEKLSGGNQQKTLIARWLLRDAEVYLLDEPTRGVDIASKSAIHRLLRELAADGKAIVLVSSDFEELIEISDRMVVMARGRLVASFERGAWSRSEILAVALQAGPNDQAASSATPTEEQP